MNLDIVPSLRKHMRSHDGFTLMEILIVIVILGIIMTLGAGTYARSQLRSRDNRRKSDLKNISIALEAYYNDKGQFPNEGPAGEICDDENNCAWDVVFDDANDTVYMVKIPGDPRSGQHYTYDVGGGNRSYQLYARLENTEDSAVRNASDEPIVFTGVSCGAKDCNYGTSSSNTTADSGRTVGVDPNP